MTESSGAGPDDNPPNPPIVASPGVQSAAPAAQAVTATASVNPPQVMLAVGAEVSRFSSPFPPPEMLKQYTELVPDAAERLMVMVEQEARHRRSLESKRLEADILDQKAERSERRRGQWLGFAIGVIAIAAGSLTSVLGHPIAGGFIGTAGVVGLVTVFVIGRRGEAKDTGQPKPKSK